MKPSHLRDLFVKQKIGGDYTAFIESIACSLAKYRSITPDVIERAREAAGRAK